MSSESHSVLRGAALVLLLGAALWPHRSRKVRVVSPTFQDTLDAQAARAANLALAEADEPRAAN